MSATVTRSPTWVAANAAQLEAELDVLRRRLERHVDWLRHAWSGDPLAGARPDVVGDAEARRVLDGQAAARRRFVAEQPGAVAEREQEVAAGRRALVAAGTPASLDVLTAVFALTPAERDVLLLAVAGEADPALARLFAYVHDDGRRAYATPWLARALAEDEDGADAAAEVDKALSPASTLRRFVLLEPAEPGPPGEPAALAPLAADARIADYVRGINRTDERLQTVVRRAAPAAPVAPEHESLAARVAAALSDDDARTTPVAGFAGPPAAGGRTVAAELCRRLGIGLVELDAAALPDDPAARADVLRRLEREARLLGHAYLLDAPAQELVDRLQAPLVVLAPRPYEAARPILWADVERPGPEDRRALWEQVAPGGRRLTELAARFELGAEEIVAAGHIAAGRARIAIGPGVAPTDEQLWDAARDLAAWEAGELARRERSTRRWEELVLPDDTLTQLHDIAAQVEHSGTVLGTWGLGAHERGRAITALFAGESGTGKTLAAEVLAGHLGLDLYRIDLSAVVSKYVGETEKNLRRIFDGARRSSAVLLFDEADALFGRRTEVRDSHDRYANIEVNYLLQALEDYGGLAILATNRRTSIDSAFLRRLRFVVAFPLPDVAERRRMWDVMLPPSVPREDLDLDAAAQLDLAGGSIRTVAVNAAFLAASEHAPVRPVHLRRAAEREYAKLGRLIPTAALAALEGDR